MLGVVLLGAFLPAMLAQDTAEYPTVVAKIPPMVSAIVDPVARTKYPEAWFYTDSTCHGRKFRESFTFSEELNDKEEKLNKRVALGVARDPQEGLGVRPGGGCLYLNGKEGEKIKIDIPYHDQGICHVFADNVDQYSSHIAAEEPCSNWTETAYTITVLDSQKLLEYDA